MELLERHFAPDIQWHLLSADDGVGVVGTDQFPGSVLMDVGFGTLADAKKVPWQQDLSPFQLVNNAKLRVHLYQAPVPRAVEPGAG